MSGRGLDRVLVVGALLGLLGVAAGAMGAHALQGRLSEQQLDWWRTAAHYTQLHAAVLVAIGLATSAPRVAALRVAATALAAGIAIFGGTLAAMALGAPRWLGAVTPLGGVCLLAGWLSLAVAGARARRGPVADHDGPR